MKKKSKSIKSKTVKQNPDNKMRELYSIKHQIENLFEQLPDFFKNSNLEYTLDQLRKSETMSQKKLSDFRLYLQSIETSLLSVKSKIINANFTSFIERK